MRNGNEACLTTTSMKSGHRSKVKVVLALGVTTIADIVDQILYCIKHKIATYNLGGRRKRAVLHALRHAKPIE